MNEGGREGAGGGVPLSRVRVAEQLRTLGVRAGGILLVHTAFRAVRPVEGGPEGLVRALLDALGPEGTLVMPSWTGDGTVPFDPERTPAAADLGVTAELFRRLPGVRRSRHPFAFAALGPQAETVVDTPLPSPPHGPGSPVSRVRDLGGQLLLLGCGHDANTSLHLAELEGGAPYRVRYRVTILEGGALREVEIEENDSCCRRFGLADGWLRAEGAQREGRVGYAPARLMEARTLVRIAADRVRRDPLLFLHPPEEGCAECDRARAGIP